MARAGQLQAGETLEQFAARMGISLEELLGLNPNLTTDNLVEGLSLNLPSPIQPHVPTAASSASQAPAGSPTGETGQLGELTGGSQGLWDEMMKEFATAFQAFLSAPAFLKGPETARRAKGPTPGHTRQQAAFLRGIEPELRDRYSEQAMRQMAETGEIATLTAGEFLKGINVREEQEMHEPGTVRGGRRYGAPAITPRRLRF